MFRSAALSHGPRVVGVLLSGCLDDGVAGLEAVKAHGGVAIAQSPQEAIFPGLPQSAADRVALDFILPASDIASKLYELCSRPPETGPAGASENATNMGSESPEEIVERDRRLQITNERRNEPTIFTCPDCGGTLWQLGSDVVTAFRCHTGHRYSAINLLVDQLEASERALYTALRMLTDSRILQRQLASKARHQVSETFPEWFEHQAQVTEGIEAQLKQVIESLGEIAVENLDSQPDTPSEPG